jgi:hypothetical protein
MARLTEEQIQLMRPFIVEAPEGRITRARYPMPRRRRSLTPGVDDGLGGIDLGALIPPPGGGGTARLIPFSLRATAADMSVGVSQRIAGPAYLAEGYWLINIASSITVPTFSILYATDGDGGGTGFTVTTVVTGTSIFEPGIVADATAANYFNRDGIMAATSFTQTPHGFPIGKLIPLNSFFLKFVFRGVVGAAGYIIGWVRIIESVSPAGAAIGQPPGAPPEGASFPTPAGLPPGLSAPS